MNATTALFYRQSDRPVGGAVIATTLMSLAGFVVLGFLPALIAGSLIFGGPL